MKNYLALAFVCLLAASCSNESDELVNNAQTENTVVPVRVHVGGFSVSMEDFSGGSSGLTRSEQTVESYQYVKAVTLAFYNTAGTEVYNVTQMREGDDSYATFGEFACELPIGNYTMVAVARGDLDGNVFTLTSPTEATYSDRALETFCATQDVRISNTAAIDLDVTLDRVMAKLQIRSTDNRTNEIPRHRTTFSAGSKSFNPTTGYAIDNSGFTITNSPTTAIGSPVQLGSYIFLTGDEQTMNVTIECLDANDNVLFSKLVQNVPFKRNQCTILRGALFSVASSGTAAFQVETSWEPDVEMAF